MFYYRYVRADGSRDSYPIGYYDPKGVNGLTVIQARDRAAEFSRQYRSGERNLRSEILKQSVNQMPEKFSDAVQGVNINTKNNTEEKQPLSAASNDTFGDMLDTYVKYLVGRRAESAEDVRKSFDRSLRKPFPELCAKRAATVTTKDLLPPLEVLIDQGKGPSALKLRTQMYSAFERAVKAENDPRIKDRKIIFGLQDNPVREIPAMSEYKNAGERALSENELAHYVYELILLPDSTGKDALLVSLSLGAQRMKQLLRVTSSNIDFEGQHVTDKSNNTLQIATITLKDGKGRRMKPRNHVLPILGYATSILSRLVVSKNVGVEVIFIENGKPITPAATSRLVTAISRKLLAEGKIRAPFCYADIRRTCETLFANYDVHKDIRAQIQSHGLSGVQETHYDRYEYLTQKHEALTLWNRKMEELIAKYVVKNAG